MIRAVLLDFYNTLYGAHEWFELEVRTLPAEVLRLMGEHGASYTPTQEQRALAAYREVRREVHRSGTEVSAEDGVARSLRAVGIEPPPNLHDLIARLMRESYRPDREEPGAVECVRRLRADGYAVAVVSNALWGDFLRWSLDGSGVADCFSGVFASAEVGFYKSSPRLYETVLSGLGVHPDEAVMVGDSLEWDVRGAQAAGLRAVWYQPIGGPTQATVPSSIRNLDYLSSVLSHWGR